ncbi:hypothetical protein GGX14DRAFT_396843 [Mycena pura]|uniref:Uncharacterized protein n=1 Tax=Mycena pura TaxID=153505 RepID=A0AAD6YB76_9AGAR|nr:hypothetical protein GGX14DRAFT_396843 [Mycena pura]
MSWKISIRAFVRKYFRLARNPPPALASHNPPHARKPPHALASHAHASRATRRTRWPRTQPAAHAGLARNPPHALALHARDPPHALASHARDPLHMLASHATCCAGSPRTQPAARAGLTCAGLARAGLAQPAARTQAACAGLARTRPTARTGLARARLARNPPRRVVGSGLCTEASGGCWSGSVLEGVPHTTGEGQAATGGVFDAQGSGDGKGGVGKRRVMCRQTASSSQRAREGEARALMPAISTANRCCAGVSCGTVCAQARALEHSAARSDEQGLVQLHPAIVVPPVEPRDVRAGAPEVQRVHVGRADVRALGVDAAQVRLAVRDQLRQRAGEERAAGSSIAVGGGGEKLRVRDGEGKGRRTFGEPAFGGLHAARVEAGRCELLTFSVLLAEIIMPPSSSSDSGLRSSPLLLPPLAPEGWGTREGDESWKKSRQHCEQKSATCWLTNDGEGDKTRWFDHIE